MAQITPTMVLECACGLRPGDDAELGTMQLHSQVEHGTDEVSLNLVAACTCGTTMELTETRATGGGFKDWFRCPACGNTGFVRRGPGKG